jgi:hypothetical protein
MITLKFWYLVHMINLSATLIKKKRGLMPSATRFKIQH